MAAGRLDVLLGLDAAEFTKGLTKAEYEAKAFSDSMLKLGGQIGTALGAGATAAAVAIGYMTKSAIDAADHLNDLSKATGVSVENLGGIGFAASQAGADLDGVAASFGKLNIKIAEAARGEKEAAEAFKAIGVAVKDAEGKTRAAEDVFKDVATAFAGFADGPEKAALGMAIFGKSYQSLLPLLADGGKALQDNIDYYKKFGGTTTEVAKQADAFNDSLGKIQLVTGQLGRSLASELLPPLQAVVDELLKAAESSDAFSTISKAARGAFEAIAVAGANVIFVFQGVGREIGAIAAQLAALAQGDIKGFHAISDAVKEDGIRARKELDALEQRILGLAAKPSLASQIGTANPDRALDRLKGGLPAAPRLGGGTTGNANKDKIDESTQAYARYVEQLSSGLEKEQQLTKVQEVTRAIEQNRFGELIPQQKELLLLLAAQADAADEYTAKIKHLAEQERNQNRALEERANIIDDLTGRKKDKEVLRKMKILDEALAAGPENGGITLEEHAAGMKTFWDGAAEGAKKADDATEQFGLTFASAVGEFITNPTSGKSFFQALMEDLLQLTTQMLVVQPIAKLLKDTLSGMTSGGSSGYGDLLGSLFGSGSQSMVGVFAGGTDFVQRDGMAMVHRGERIVTASENRQGSGGVVQNFTISAPDGSVSRATQSQIAAQAARGLVTAGRRFN